MDNINNVARVKFNESEDSHKLFWKTTRSNVHRYFSDNGISPKANTSMVLKTVLMLCIYLLPLILLLSMVMNTWIPIVFVIIAGIGKAGVGMSVMHDGLHGSYSEKKWVNKMIGATMYLIGGNVFNWKIQHNIYHHAYTNITGHDEDIQTRWIIRLSQHTPLRNINRFQFVYAFILYSLMTFSMLFGDIKQLLEYNKSGITEKYNSDPLKELFIVIVVKITYLFVLLILPMLVTSFLWWQVLIGFTIMHLVAGFIMSLVFQMAHISEHASQPMPDANGNIQNEWAVHQILTTSNFAPGNKLLNWYVGGLNFQIEHHLFPNICHVHYAKISSIIQGTTKDFGIAYNMKPTLRAAIKSHARRLSELGTV